MVLESEELERRVPQLPVRADPTDDPARRRRGGGHVEQADPLDRSSVRGDVVAAEELVAPTDPEDHASRRSRIRQLGRAGPEIASDEDLDPVGAASYQHDVRPRREAIATRDFLDPHVEPSPLGAPPQGQDVPAIAIGAQQVRVQGHQQ